MTTAPLRLLFLLPFAPRPDARHGGKATAQLLAHLAERHQCALLYLRAPDEEPADPGLTSRLDRVWELAAPSRQGWRRRLRVAWALARGLPVEAADTCTPAAARRIRRVAEEWQPDVVHLEMERTLPYLPALDSAGGGRLLVAHEPAAQAALDRLRAAPGLERVLRVLDLRAWRRLEELYLPRLDALVAYTERDRRILAQRAPGLAVDTIPLRIDLPAQPLDPLGADPPCLVFVGGFGHPPNVDAALRLARHILPRVRARVPEAGLVLVGDRPPRSVRRLAGRHVAVAAGVPDVAPYLDRAAVVCAPLRLGGGARVKVVEALAAGKAVVASPLAVEGLEVVDGEQLLVADGDEETADAVCRLLEDPHARAALATRARAWAERALDWEPVVAAYDALYRRLAR